MVAVLSAGVGATWQGRAQAQGETQPSDTVLITAGASGIRAFEKLGSEEYTLGLGDEIIVDVIGHSDLGGRQTVGPDGRITLPVAGSLLVAEKTRPEAANLIQAALANFYKEASVTVAVSRYTSNHVLIVGAVEHPGLLQFDSRPTLIEAVTRAGAIGGDPTGKGSGLATRPAIPERCVIYRGSTTAVSVDLKKLLNSGSSLADISLRRDDIVYIPSTTDRYISLLGQVQHPGAFQLESDATLQKLLAEAGGLTDAAGDDPALRIISVSTGTTRTIRLKTLLQPQPIDLTLRSGDILFVPKSGFNKASYILEKISPLVSIFTAFAFLDR